MLSTFAYVVYIWTRTYPAQIEGKLSPTWNHITWCYHLGNIEEITKEIHLNEMVAANKINCNKLFFALKLMKGLFSPFNWMDGGPCKIFSVWFSLNIQLEKNWLDVLENIKTTD